VAATRQLRAEQIVWDVEAQHLDEAEFCFELFEAALDAPHYTFDELAAGPEARLLAHVDGLIIGGPVVARKLLLPTIQDPHAGYEIVAAAGLAVLGGDDPEARELLLCVLDDATEPEPRAGVVRALELHASAELEARLVGSLAGAPVEGVAARLEVLAARRALVGDWLRGYLVDADPRIARAAARLARRCPDRQVLDALAPLAHAADPELRQATLETALCRGVAGAWESAIYWAFVEGESPFRRQALGWVALLGDARAHQRLLGLVDDAGRRADAIWALGFAGRVSAVDRCVELLADDEVGPLAGELIHAIAGLPLDEDRYWRQAPPQDDGLPPLELDELDADLIPEAEASLPRPEPDAIAGWWQAQREHFDPSLRYLGGRPQNAEVMLDALRHGSARRRHLLALELAFRSNGAALINTRALSAVQRLELDALAQLEAVDFQRGLAPG
jgi:uncharacterized protein (TIGR02270 family)